jgi:hypothetical protein
VHGHGVIEADGPLRTELAKRCEHFRRSALPAEADDDEVSRHYYL